MTTFAVTFDRIGRRHDVPPLVTTVDVEPGPEYVPDRLACAIYDYARPFLRSSNVEVTVNLDGQTGEGNGFISCGFHSGGRFTIEPQEVPT